MPDPANPATLLHLEDYRPLVGDAEVDVLRALAARLQGATVKMVNSTSMGGGVAEILNRLVPLLEDLGLPTLWDVITGGDDFWAITKGFHNALHGADYEPPPGAFEIFEGYQRANRQHLRFDEDFVVIHDPQPLGLVEARDSSHAPWVWRCHIDVSHPHNEIWEFLLRYVDKYDAMLISSPSFSRTVPLAQYLFYPSIDPLAQKNCPLEEGYIQNVLEQYGIDPARPILTQISRFDRLKDPLGVIQAFKMVKKYADCQLVLAGGSATDDPEGWQVLAEVQETAAGDPDIHILNLPPWSALEINALQQASTIIIQKSLREGFGLTVSEALWKKKPVVASAVGGIPLQVIHKQTGLLAHSVEGTAYQIRYLLSNPAIAARLGRMGYEHVKENFIITCTLKRYLLLFLALRDSL